MACTHLAALLRETDRQDLTGQAGPIAAHIRACPDCNLGLERLTRELLGPSSLSCDECRAHFPAYYEATREDHPLVKISDTDYIEVTLHLVSCAACREQYEVLLLLSEAEESGEGR
jgi:uncharacterized protein YbaR (Trm112 family)